MGVEGGGVLERPPLDLGADHPPLMDEKSAFLSELARHREKPATRAPPRRMTAMGAPGAHYILDGDERLRPPSRGLPRVAVARLRTRRDGVGGTEGADALGPARASRVAGGNANADARPDLRLGPGGSGGGAAALRYRQATYGAGAARPPAPAPAPAPAARAPGTLPRHPAGSVRDIVFPGGKGDPAAAAAAAAAAAPRRRRAPRPASAARGSSRPQKSRGTHGAARRAAVPREEHFPRGPGRSDDDFAAADGAWPRPITPDPDPPDDPRRHPGPAHAQAHAHDPPHIPAPAFRRPAGMARLGASTFVERRAARSVAARLDAAVSARLEREAAEASGSSSGSSAGERDASDAALLERLVEEAIAVGLAALVDGGAEAMAEAIKLAETARRRERVRASLTRAVTKNRPSAEALAEARRAGVRSDDPAVRAMEACVKRAEREAAMARLAEEMDAWDPNAESKEEEADEDRLAAAPAASRTGSGSGSGLGSEGGSEEAGGGEEASPGPARASSPSPLPASLDGGRLVVDEMVGEGAYGVVMRCTEASTGARRAVKAFKIRENDPDAEEVRRTSAREIATLRDLRHPNVVAHVGDFTEGGKLYVVMEFVPRTLLEILDARPQDAPGLPKRDVRRFVKQLCRAVAFMHARGFVYRDIKPENVLVTDSKTVKLCDFGFARKVPETEAERNKLTDYVATRWYRAPELLLGRPWFDEGSKTLTRTTYGRAVDMWAVGCLMGELTDGDPLFPGQNDVDQLVLIQRCVGRLTTGMYAAFELNPHNDGVAFDENDRSVPEESLEHRYLLAGKMTERELDFMRGLLEVNPNDRATGEACLAHEYLRFEEEGEEETDSGAESDPGEE